MSTRERLEFDGEVIDSCKGKFKVKLDNPEKEVIVMCTLSGKIRQNSVKI